MSSAFDIDRPALRRALDRAAADYDDAAVLQREVLQRLLARLAHVSIAPAVVVDVGCRTGSALADLKERYPQALLLALDFSPAMLRRSGCRGAALLCTEPDRLPLAGASIDLLFSNLALARCADLDAAFREFHRALRPGGLLHFSTLGPDTLLELRAAWASVDDQPHIHAFADLHDVGDRLVRAGFTDAVLDVDRLTVTYSDPLSLLADLRATGAVNATAGRRRSLTGRRRFAAMLAAYERQRRDGLLPVSCEVVFGQAWVPARAPVRERRRSEFAVDLAAIGRRTPPA